jgi:hypothetical protein
LVRIRVPWFYPAIERRHARILLTFAKRRTRLTGNAQTLLRPLTVGASGVTDTDGRQMEHAAPHEDAPDGEGSRWRQRRGATVPSPAAEAPRQSVGAKGIKRDGPAREPPARRSRRVHMLGVIVAALAFFWWLIFVFFWVVFIYVTITIARSKGHSGLLWGILACFFPLITIIIVLLLPDRSRG